MFEGYGPPSRLISFPASSSRARRRNSRRRMGRGQMREQRRRVGTGPHGQRRRRAYVATFRFGKVQPVPIRLMQTPTRYIEGAVRSM